MQDQPEDEEQLDIEKPGHKNYILDADEEMTDDELSEADEVGKSIWLCFYFFKKKKLGVNSRQVWPI